MFVFRRRQQRGPDEDVLRVPGHQARPALSRRGGHQGGGEILLLQKIFAIITQFQYHMKFGMAVNQCLFYQR